MDCSDGAAAEEELAAARLVRRLRRVPPAFWPLVKPKVVLGAVASVGSGVSTTMTALFKRQEPEALKLRDDQETFEKVLTDLNEKHMLSVMKTAPLLLKVPPEAAVSVASLGLQSVLAANGVAEAVVAKLWWSSSFAAQAAMASAVAPGLALLARYAG